MAKPTPDLPDDAAPVGIDGTVLIRAAADSARRSRRSRSQSQSRALLVRHAELT